MDHLTAEFGRQFYDVSMRRLAYPDWQTTDPKKQGLELFGGNLQETPDMPRRKFGNLGIPFNFLETCFFGLGSSKYSLLDSLRYYVYKDETATLPEIDPPQIPEALRIDFTPSFWQLADSYYDKMLVSKKPYLQKVM